MYLFIVYRYSPDMYTAHKQFYRKHLVFYFKEAHDRINWWKMNNLIQIMIQGLWSESWLVQSSGSLPLSWAP